MDKLQEAAYKHSTNVAFKELCGENLNKFPVEQTIQNAFIAGANYQKENGSEWEYKFFPKNGQRVMVADHQYEIRIITFADHIRPIFFTRYKCWNILPQLPTPPQI